MAVSIRIAIGIEYDVHGICRCVRNRRIVHDNVSKRIDTKRYGVVIGAFADRRAREGNIAIAGAGTGCCQGYVATTVQGRVDCRG